MSFDERYKQIKQDCEASKKRTDELVKKYLNQIDPLRPQRYDAKRREIVVVIQTYVMELNQLADKKKRIEGYIEQQREKLKKLTSDYEAGNFF